MKHRSIIQICPCYVDLDRETGGVANVVRQICLQLARRQRRVRLICGNRELGKTMAPAGRVQANEFIEVEVLDQRSHPLLGPVSELTRHIRALSQDSVAHVHTCFSAFTEVAMRTLHSRQIPFIFTPHGKLSSHLFEQNYWAKQMWWAYRGRKSVQNAAAIAASSIEEARQLERFRLNQQVHSIPNGYESPSDLRSLDRIIPNPYILFLGYLDPRKQPGFLIEAFARSKARHTHLLVFVGPDSYSLQDSLQLRAKELGVDKRVMFYGPAYGPTKWSFLQHATCICLPSLGEGLPVVLCEALGAGTPAIFSQECNFSELADEGAGITPRGFDATLWGDGIDKICLDRPSYESMKKSAERLRPQYTWKEISHRWQRLYDFTANARP